MQKMKYDMSGAACMYGAITAIARLGVPLRVTGLLTLAENMPSGTATRPGDIVRAMNGKHIEVDNTDAEGRLVLADALCYAVGEGATHIIDSATLTGAVTYALGSTRAAVMTNDDALAGRVMAAGDAAGERYWQLPMDAEYGKLMKGELADLKNVSGTPEAGTVTAAKFLEEFVDGTPWVHLDIAGTAWPPGTTRASRTCARGRRESPSARWCSWPRRGPPRRAEPRWRCAFSSARSARCR